MIQLPQLHESLLIANERLVDRARRRARLFRTGMLSSVAAVSIGGAAVAGQALWGPVLGHEDGNRPTATGSPVPAEQRSLLGVLRRDQTATDRGAAARAALAAATREYRGVRLGDVRLMREGRDGDTLVLIPVAGLAATGRPGTSSRDDALCVATGRNGDVSSLSCFSAQDVRAGRAVGLADLDTWGVVPDGVTAAVARTPGGGEQRVAVTDNAFSLPASRVDPEHREATWIGEDGRTIETAGGTRMTLVVNQGVPGSIRPGFRDCGADRGGIVPTDVACGAEAERWRPAPGEDGSGLVP